MSYQQYMLYGACKLYFVIPKHISNRSYIHMVWYNYEDTKTNPNVIKGQSNNLFGGNV